MVIEITPQGIITCFALLGAVAGILAYVAKTVRWFDRQKQQDLEIKELKTQHQKDIDALKEQHQKDLDKLKGHHDKDLGSVKEEQTLMVYGLLACLKGLQEQGCNGEVTKAIEKIEKHLNEEAHK